MTRNAQPEIFAFLQVMRSGLVLEHQLLGESFKIDFSEWAFEIFLPSLNFNPQEPFHRLELPSGFRLEDGFDLPADWGSIVEFEGTNSKMTPKNASVKTLLVAVRNTSGGAEKSQARLAWEGFWENFLDLVETNSNQDSENGSVISHRGASNYFLKVQDGVLKPGSLHVQVGVGPLIRGEVVTRQIFERALELSLGDKRAPEVHRLLRRSRFGFHQSDFRRTVIEAATAQEVLLSELVRSELLKSGRDLFHQLRLDKRTLGELLRNWRSIGGWLPEGQSSELTELRNRVVHEGYLPTEAEAFNYYEITRELIEHFVHLPFGTNG